MAREWPHFRRFKPRLLGNAEDGPRLLKAEDGPNPLPDSDSPEVEDVKSGIRKHGAFIRPRFFPVYLAIICWSWHVFVLKPTGLSICMVLAIR